MRMTNDEFRQKPWRVHTFLNDVPLHDLWVLHLPGGGEGRTLKDFQQLLAFDDLEHANPIVAGLFKLRWLLGRLFGWDEEQRDIPAASYVHRLTSDDRQRSRVEPGSNDFLGRAIYHFEDEALTEIINRTVHAFVLLAMEQTADGYRVVLVTYVKRVSLLTPFYMALIDPFRKLLIYPTIIRKMERIWTKTYT